jgi:ABC-type glycerol-3-phosphate transport system permease component
MSTRRAGAAPTPAPPAQVRLSARRDRLATTAARRGGARGLALPGPCDCVPALLVRSAHRHRDVELPADVSATIANFSAPFAGLDNYRFILRLHEPGAIVHTFLFTAGSLFFQFIIGFALALLFSLRFPGRTLARSLIIVPWLLPLIVTGVIFRFLFQAEGGAVNQLLKTLGLTHHPQWLNEPHLAFWTILIANIGSGYLLHPPPLQRAPDADGRSGKQRSSTGAGPWQGSAS